jgi:hypothetical protein
MGLACATPQTMEQTEQIRAGAKYRIGDVTSAAPSVQGVDAAALLRTGLERSLAKRALLASAVGGTSDYRLDVAVVEYEPGNAFKRWLVPGYGATLLRVRGQLTDPRNGTVAARVDHQRRVLAGGAFTISAWETIFASVSDDIARDLEMRSKGEGFVVNLEPWAGRELPISPSPSPHEFSIEPFVDARAERGRIGERFAAFGVSMGDVRFARDVAGFMEETVADDLRAAGHQVRAGSSATEIRGEVTKFWVRTDTTPVYWDVVGAIELKLSLSKPGASSPLVQSTHACESTERTWIYPSRSLVERVMNACLGELMQRVRGDAMWDAV